MTGSQKLLQRLELFETISGEARQALLGALGPEHRVQKHDVLRSAGSHADAFWVVEEGWLFDSSRTAKGGRQVFNIYQTGDVMGLPDLGWDVAVCDMTAGTPARLRPVTKSDFSALMAAHPSLAAYFLTFGVYDHTRLIDRLRTIGRMEAIKRVAHFLLQVFADQSEPDGLPAAGRFALHLDQQVIGDAVGLTNMSVSRMMNELERRGLIARRGPRSVEVPDVAALAALGEFVERRRAVPLSWLMRGVIAA